MQPSEASAKSGRSRVSNDFQAGPVMIDGQLFVRLKRCSLCGVMNSDPNTLRCGPFGPDTSKFQIWAKGSSIKPEGPLDKACGLAFVQGVFLAQFATVEAFEVALKAGTAQAGQLQMEWNAALQAKKEALENSTCNARLGKAILAQMEEAVLAARKTAVQSFKQSQRRVTFHYKLVPKDKYEAQYPGRVQKKGLQTKFFDTEEGRIECVMIRKLPGGERELHIEDLAGTTISETTEGGATLRANQASQMHKSLASKIQLSREEQDDVAMDDADDSEVEPVKPPVETQMVSDGSGSDTEGAAGSTFDWATSCLLDEFNVAPPKQSLAKAKAKAAALPATKSAPKLAVRASAPVPQTFRASSSDTGFAGQRKPNKQIEQSIEVAASSVVDNASRKKFLGKSVEDILQPHGWGSLCASFSEIMPLMQHEDLDSWLMSDGVEKFNAMTAQVRKEATALHKGYANLDIKAKNLTSTPAAVTDTIANHRNKTKAVLDACTVFTTTRKSQDANKMEKAIALLVSCGVSIPLSFRCLLFAEKALDLIRFRMMDDFVIFVGPNGYFYEGGVCLTGDDAKKSCTRLREDSIEDALSSMIKSLESDSTGENQKDLYNLANSLVADVADSLSPEVAEDIRDFHSSVSDGKAGPERCEAIARLRGKSSNDAYYGIFRSLATHVGWGRLLGKVEMKVRGAAQATSAISGAMSILQKIGSLLWTQSDRDELDRQTRLAVDLGASVAEAEDAKVVNQGIAKLFTSFALTSEHGLKMMDDLWEEAMQVIEQQSDQSITPLEARVQVDRIKLSLKDTKFRYRFDFAALRAVHEANFDKVSTASQDKVSELCINLDVFDAYDRAAVNVLSLQTVLQQLRIDQANGNSQSVVEHVGTLSGIVSKINEALATKLSDKIERINNLRGSWGVQDHGASMYNASLGAFKKLVADVVNLAFGDVKSPSLTGMIGDVRASTFTLQQQASWSNSPSHDRAIFGFIEDHLLAVLQVNDDGDALQWASIPSLAAVLDLEDTMPKLEWVLGPEMAIRLIAFCRTLQGQLTPKVGAAKAKMMSDISKHYKKLETLVTHDEEMNDTKFFAKLSVGKVESIRTARSDLGGAVERAQAMFKKLGDPEPAEVANAINLMKIGRCQTVRFGFLSFLKNDQLTSDSEAAAKIRGNVKAIWSVQEADKNMVEYLGEDLCKRIKEIANWKPSVASTAAASAAAIAEDGADEADTAETHGT